MVCWYSLPGLVGAGPMRRFGVSKYKNKPCVVNGIKFQSTKESKRYLDLLKMEKAGLISNLKMQHRFKVIGSQSYECPETGVIIKERPTYYKADFSYTNEKGRLVV
jgi:hypothetical protein